MHYEITFYYSLSFCDRYLLYTGTISTITKFFNNPIIYKLVYWFLSIAVYVVIIYISITYTRTTPSTRLNNNVIFTSLIVFYLFLN